MWGCFALAAALLAGCYAPSANAGAPCSTEGTCPTGQECRSGWCFAEGAPHDADEQVLDQSDAPSDADIDAIGIDASTYVPWGTPVELTSLETPGNGESDPSFTADRLTAVITSDTAVNDADIYLATRAALTDTFTPALLAAVNATGFDDQSPEISADGKTLYFTSNRSGSDEIYISTYTTMWSAPTVAADLSSAQSDGDLAISPDGLSAVVNRESGTKGFYFYTRAATTDAFSGATLHSELGVAGANIASPTITNGAEVIYFHAGATRQLFRAQKKGNGTYTTPAPVSELNVATVRCAAPFVVQTDDYMVFEKAGNIFETSRTLP